MERSHEYPTKFQRLLGVVNIFVPLLLMSAAIVFDISEFFELWFVAGMALLFAMGVDTAYKSYVLDSINV
jgi:hypothetical protein